MAEQRDVYSYNHSATHLPAYPPQLDYEYQDYKAPVEDDIIDSYTTTAVPLPKPGASLYDVSSDGHGPPLYPPMHQKTSFQSSWAGHSEGDGGGGMGSDYHLAPKETVKEERRSLLQILLPDSIACRLYVLTVLIQTCIDITIEADLFLRVRTLDASGSLSTNRLPVYLSIFAFAHVFQLALAIDAVHARNTLQFMFLTVFNATLLAYAVIQKSEIVPALPTSGTGISDISVNVLTTIIPIVIAVAECAYIALGWKIWREFGWKVYKRLGADRSIKRMYARYQIFICIMKFDVFFFIGFSVQLIALVLQIGDWERYVTIAALPFSFLVLANGMLAARYENTFMMGTFMLGCAGAMVYFVYKLYRIFQLGNDLTDISRMLIIFAIIAIVLLIATVIMAIIVLRNFGGGLRYHISTKRSTTESSRGRNADLQHRKSKSYPLGNPNRMSID